MLELTYTLHMLFYNCAMETNKWYFSSLEKKIHKKKSSKVLIMLNIKKIFAISRFVRYVVFKIINN